jgi:hypothetical protein
MTQSTRIPYSLFFSYLGYIIFSIFLAAAILELGATILRSAHHWMHPASAQSLANSPPYQGYPWAQAFWNEEFLRCLSEDVALRPFSDLGRTTLVQQPHQRRRECHREFAKNRKFN